MREFARLFNELDNNTSQEAKLKAMEEYFRSAPAENLVWALFFLSGRKLTRVVSSTQLRRFCMQHAGMNLQPWLFQECYDNVGDLAECVSLLLPQNLALDPEILSNQADEFSSTATSQLSLSKQMILFGNDFDYSSVSTELSELVNFLDRLRGLPEREIFVALSIVYQKFNQTERFLLGKLLTGGFRVGVSEKLVVRALSRFSGLSEAVLQERLISYKPEVQAFQNLISKEGVERSPATPYPFFLAQPLTANLLTANDTVTSSGQASLQALLDQVAEQLLENKASENRASENKASAEISPFDKTLPFSVEWKWDGIRSQLVKRAGQVFIWSRGEELVTETFPEIAKAALVLPDGIVIDGEILAFREGDVLPFGQLQKRLNRKEGNIGARLLDEVPCVFMAFDLLEFEGKDLRLHALEERKQYLQRLLTPGACLDTPSCAGALSPRLRYSPELGPLSLSAAYALRQQSRLMKVEGLMLKRLGSVYGIGRKGSDWWKWKVDPYTVDAVLVAAQRGHGRRASLYSDYTFALWHEGKLVSVAKAYSGLSDEEMKEVDRFVKANTIEKFGPVRSVKPELVFELAFEAIQLSSRHKSGVAVRFPRILRIRTDKPIEEADTLQFLRALADVQNENREKANSTPTSQGQLNIFESNT
ncbi:MAG: putative ATP-dependent DNA ligase YkoU [bacterium ADurb.Bin425]|nr:MAG: putative ATP-dependent DNA ligase YkoU [bacterium ADurb.Bin425]